MDQFYANAILAIILFVLSTLTGLVLYRMRTQQEIAEKAEKVRIAAEKDRAIANDAHQWVVENKRKLLHASVLSDTFLHSFEMQADALLDVGRKLDFLLQRGPENIHSLLVEIQKEIIIIRARSEMLAILKEERRQLLLEKKAEEKRERNAQEKQAASQRDQDK